MGFGKRKLESMGCELDDPSNPTKLTCKYPKYDKEGFEEGVVEITAGRESLQGKPVIIRQVIGGDGKLDREQLNEMTNDTIQKLLGRRPR